MANTPIYDVSRLTTRTLNATPNGIDRIDLLLSNHFLSRPNAQALMFGFRGPGLFQSDRFPMPNAALEAVWREATPTRDDFLFLKGLTDRLLGEDPGGRALPVRRFSWSQARRRLIGPARSLVTYAPMRGGNPVRAARKNALFINASHFPIEWGSHVSWLDSRPDVRSVQFIHDLLPIERPELFWAREPQRHRVRLQFLARRGTAALVTSRHVEEALSSFLSKAGRADLPIFRASPPVAANFFNRPPRDARLSQARYFVICGTIEPRKNHQLLIDVWQRLPRAFGAAPPSLIVIGKRGWKCDHIFKALKNQEFGGSIIVLTDLPTSIYKHLLAHSVALLAPALAEGFGLPIGEALALGVPVIASNIEGHREYSSDQILLVDPLNVDLWEEAIVEATKTRLVWGSREATLSLRSEVAYLEELERFLRTLS